MPAKPPVLFSAPIRLILVVILGITAVDGYAATQKKPLKPQAIKTFLQLKKLVNGKIRITNPGTLKTGVAAMADAVAPMSSGTGEAANIDYSSTNVQVAGVDEGDTVKTDGHYIYSLQGNQVRIVNAYPASDMALLSTLAFDNNFTPIELYVDGDRLVVIGQGWKKQDNTSDQQGDSAAEGGQAKIAIWWFGGQSETRARVYTLADRSQPQLEREISFEGSYLSSRKIGNNIYLMGRNYPMYYRYMRPYIVDDVLPPPTEAQVTVTKSSKAAATSTLSREDIVPSVSDSSVNKGAEFLLPMKNIAFFPGFSEANYVMTTSFRLDKPAEPARFNSYLGGGDLVYASADNLYVSAADYPLDGTHSVTHVYRFSLTDGIITFTDSGEVPGTPLNQFSLDENQGYLRIATTVSNWTTDGTNWQNQSWNNLYTLDENMKVKGKLEHLAEGESIYAVRFMGNRAYMVTYEQLDPLFVIDLATPEQPRLLGQLKIPGYSNYLHPYDENHLLSLGQETVASADGSSPVVKGVKLALFDVTDPTNPAQLHSLVIGGQGTYTPASYDYKAFWFDRKRNLLGFPIDETASDATLDTYQWPPRVFQGAEVYSVSLTEGFAKQGAVSHFDDGETDNNWSHYVQRLLSIGNELYTFSESRLRANSLKDFSQHGQIDFPVTPVETIVY